MEIALGSLQGGSSKIEIQINLKKNSSEGKKKW